MNYPSWLQSHVHSSLARRLSELISQGKLQDIEPSLQLALLTTLKAQLERDFNKLDQLQLEFDFQMEECGNETHVLLNLAFEEKALRQEIKQLEQVIEKLEGGEA
jgi:BMFP domain-containing protein YqiC